MVVSVERGEPALRLLLGEDRVVVQEAVEADALRGVRVLQQSRLCVQRDLVEVEVGEEVVCRELVEERGQCGRQDRWLLMAIMMVIRRGGRGRGGSGDALEQERDQQRGLVRHLPDLRQ